MFQNKKSVVNTAPVIKLNLIQCSFRNFSRFSNQNIFMFFFHFKPSTTFYKSQTNIKVGTMTFGMTALSRKTLSTMQHHVLDQTPMQENRAVLICHRILINSGVEKMNDI